MDKNLKKVPFTCSERELLVALVRERPIIEDKCTNAKNIDLKKQAWEELAVAFNAQQYVSQKHMLQLKRCWENIKSKRKKELSQVSRYMSGTGGGPPGGGPTASSVVDEICPFINLVVPGVIDSNSIEISDGLKKSEPEIETDLSDDIVDKKPPLKRKYDSVELFGIEKHFEAIYVDTPNQDDAPSQPKRKFISETANTPTGCKKFQISETDARIKRCIKNMQQDQVLHELRVQRENILIEREQNILDFEKNSHSLQLKN